MFLDAVAKGKLHLAKFIVAASDNSLDVLNVKVSILKYSEEFYVANWWLSHDSHFLDTRVDLHTPKMLIIQFHTSSVWKNTCHTTFIQFLKMVENWYKLISEAV